MKKICIKCHRELEISSFRKDKSRKDGFHPYCKECQLLYRRKDDKNLVRIEGERRRHQKYNRSDKGKKLNNERLRRLRSENPERYRTYSQRGTRKRIESGKQAVYHKLKCDTDINYRIGQRLRVRVYHALKGKTKSIKTLTLLGCSIEQLKQHLELQFTEGMSWDNYGKWHIDHIKPCDSFNLENQEEQLKCFHYTNLQPLWAKDNLSKSNKL